MNHDTRLFFQRWLANPGQVASLFPSSDKLSDIIAAKTLQGPEEFVLELGAGTGAIGRALLRAGLSPARLVMVELDEVMCDSLREEFPNSLVLAGDALRPSTLLPPEVAEQVTTCVSGLPILHYKLERQRAFVKDVFSLMVGSPRLVQYGNMPRPPIAHRPLNLSVKRLGFGWSGIVPHFIWEFRPAS
ncbi:MAG TPA: rRNA adenine N-6-methyltransferase family protein [Kiloniellales bacterium]|nr:rRNA adenine N-6-methyltransferase family protein [Kiloniellales bacterium]